MHVHTRIAAICIAGMALTTIAVVPAAAATSYANCTALHRTYPHGVGRLHAHDHTTGTPVTSFKHSTRLYRKAMRHNDDLDRDGDGIACEAR